MKKLLVVLVVVALCASVTAWAGNPTPGKYQGTVNSTVTDINGKPVTAEIKTEGTKTVANVTFTDSKEIWTWDGNTLVQQELDPATNKVAAQYTATAKDGKYFVNCKTENAKQVCDAGIDARGHWTLSTTPNTFTYTYYNVGKDQVADATAQPAKRIEIVFNQAK